MPYKIKLIANQQVVYALMLDVVSIEDIRALSQEAATLMSSQSHKCYYITNLTKMRMGPTNFLEIREASKVLLSHPKLAASVTFGSPNLGDNIIAKFLTNLMAGLSKTPTKICSTQEEALRYVLGYAPSLDGILQADIRTF